jgi:hypothetical protein
MIRSIMTTVLIILDTYLLAAFLYARNGMDRPRALTDPRNVRLSRWTMRVNS